MINNALVSIISPMYNAEKYIAETIQSVLNQSYDNWEMIIVDNASTDKSASIVKKYMNINNKIKYIKLDLNSGGPAKPRNIGLENAKGEYVAFLDADDVWLSEKLESQFSFINKNKINFTSTYCSLIDGNSKDIKLSKKSYLYYKFISKKDIKDVIKNSFIITSSVLVSKAILLKFSEEKNFIAVEDFDMWLRVLHAKESKYKYQDEQLIKYRILETSASKRNDVFNQELKANIVLANFILNKPEYIWAYLNRIFFHLFRMRLKVTLSHFIKIYRKH